MNEDVKPVALVLGGIVPHCELIKQLKERGYYTILIDYTDNPPAKAVADEHLTSSTLDQEAVLACAKEKNAALVISGCVDQANVTACYVLEKLGLYAPYSYKTAKEITNKSIMKKVMMESGILTSDYMVVKSPDDLDGMKFKYPVMVKPADSNSANGVKKVNSEAALYISRNGQAVVEEYVEGKEISAYCYIRDHCAKLIMTAERISLLDGENKVIKCYASIAPAQISDSAVKCAEDTATQIAHAFHLDDTPLFFQGIVKDDKIHVIEFAPRLGGGVSFKTIKENTGFDMITATIDSYLGKTVDFGSWSKPVGKYIVNTVYAQDGIYSHTTGSEKLINDGVIEAFYHIKASGAVIDNNRANSSRICFFIVKASDDEEMLSKVQIAFDELDVYDVLGNSIIRREVSLCNLWRDLKA